MTNDNIKRAAIVTLGCKVNWYDSQAMASALKTTGFTIVPEGEPADVYIVNTCSVTAEADRKSRQAVRRLIRAHPGAAVIAAGCSSQKDAQGFAAIEGLAAVCGTADRQAVAGIALRVICGDRGHHGLAPLSSVYEEAKASEQAGHTRAVLKVEDGCDARCAYCIIPDLRGAPRSRALESIAAEAEALAARGFREIVLVGINLSRYGAGLEGNVTLADAVEAAAASGVARIRLGSLEPEAVTPELLERLAAQPSFCPHFHVSLQSGSAGTLKRMGRRYGPDGYRERLALIRRYFPGAGITTDVIVGFPGETEREFSESAAFVAAAGFLKAHVFPFSARAGTPAAAMPDQPPRAVKEARAAAMRASAAPAARAFLRGMVGGTAAVLFEEPVRGRSGWMRGYTANYVEVEAPAGEDARGEILDVRMIDTDGTIIIGEI